MKRDNLESFESTEMIKKLNMFNFGSGNPLMSIKFSFIKFMFNVDNNLKQFSNRNSSLSKNLESFIIFLNVFKNAKSAKVS